MTARPTSASWSPCPRSPTASCRSHKPATPGSTGTNPQRRPSGARSERLGGESFGGNADDVPDQTGLLQAVDDQGRDVDLVPAQPVGGRGGEGVVAVVEGLAEGRDRDQRQVARVVLALEFALAVHVAERVDAVGEVVEDEDADEAAPEQTGDRGEEGAADDPAEEEGQQQAADRPVDEGGVD